MLFKFLYRFPFYLCLFLPILWGCTDELYLQDSEMEETGELPVEFILEWPGENETRGFSSEVKTKFSDQDVIHIVGFFKTEALQEDGSYLEGQTARYGALKYNSKTRQWEAVEGNKLTWPSISTEGNFYAYYISGANGLITKFDEPITMNLSEVTPQTDPLMAPNTGDLVYGHAVKLQFQHLCSYLTLIDIEPLVSSQYFFTNVDVYTKEEGEKKSFNNAYSLTLIENDGETDPDLKGFPELKFEFIQAPDASYDNKIFISGNASTLETTDENEEKQTFSTVSYFLEPGFYSKFDIVYPAIAPNTYPYLTYDYTTIPPNAGGIEYENIPPDLEGGTTYTLTITKSPGVTIVNPPKGEGWEDDEESYEVDVKKFLTAVREGTEYVNDSDTPILEQTPGGTKLLHNVTFKEENYEDYETFGLLPDVLEGKTFDGNFHYIRDLGCPLFRNNYGTIINLGIEKIKIDAESVEYSYNGGDNTQDKSRHGALCMWNRPAALISNVRVIDVDMTISVEYTNTAPDGGEVHNIGGVVGSNTGTITELYIGGPYKISVKGEDVRNAEVIIGGIVGQNAGNAVISDVAMLDENFSMRISNDCSGDLGAYNVGGICGKSSAFISSAIISDINVNSSSSSGVISYIGGMVGMLEISEGSTGYLKDCIVSGAVEAGTTNQETSTIPGKSYIGGMVGYDNNASVTDCRASVSVTGSRTVKEGVTYGTGGGFGRILKPSIFRNLIVYGAKLISPAGLSPVGSNYVGNFAGIGPAGQTWEENYASSNITFHAFQGLDPIGDFL